MKRLWTFGAVLTVFALFACSDSSSGSGNNGGKVEDAVEGTWVQVGEIFSEPDTATITEDRVDIMGVISGTGVTMMDGLIKGGGLIAGEYELIRDTLWVDTFFADSLDGVIDTTEATPYIKIK